ncbi:Hypothetical predicted protein [Cloeon dipterum]|uniref:Voltage-dependent calcium channel gamma-1 subunit n=1 Tax=Cloeon dipterum TaxID=197152 RepID=A0A8S1BR20_9INSE|nr:Hypothetical predicted protein [Cloeon dipterum]
MAEAAAAPAAAKGHGRAARMKRRVQAVYEQVMFERRVLLGCTAAVGLCVFLWIVAVSTDHWFTLTAPTEAGVFINETKRFFLTSHSGLWRICRTSYGNASDVDNTMLTKCRYQEFFPSDQKIAIDHTIDHGSLNYSRTEVSFAIISLFLMVMGFFFSLYTFQNPRYMFKRLAGGIHFITGGSVLVVIEVLISSIDYERLHLPFVHPKGVLVSYGWSFALAWLVFLVLFVSGCAFMIFSRKRKGNKAPNDEMAMADEPTIIGR